MMARKVIQKSFGGPEVLEVIEIPQPEPQELGAGEVLVRIAFAGLNAVDWKTRAGGGAAPALGDLPFTVGWDFSGTIEAIADDVSEFAPGDRVFALSKFPTQAAAYADYAVAAANELVATPASVTDEAAAALPLAALTAWQALIEVVPGQRVLIHGAGGGVGHLAVQIARNLGAYVIGTGSGSKRDWVISLGANEFIDYRRDDFVSQLAPDKVDLVLDFVGGHTGLESVKIIKPGGLLLQFPAGIDPDAQSAAEAAGVGIAGPFVHIDKAQLSEIADQVAAGKIEVTVAAVYGLDRIGEAHRVLEDGHVAGKLVVRLS
jgi:NADPH:quinone reductase-like Zn-dependent oxidoreductase